MASGCCWCTSNLAVTVRNRSGEAVTLAYDHHESASDAETGERISISVPIETRLPAHSSAVIEVEQGGFDDSVVIEVERGGCELEVEVHEDDPTLILEADDFPCTMAVAN